MSDELFAAVKMAYEYGLSLVQHPNYICTLRHSSGWCKNIDISKQHIWASTKNKGPFLYLPELWTLLDVVQAAIAADARKDSDE